MNIAAHELKTPLVPIISYLEMLLSDKQLTREQKEKVRICLSSAKRETSLVSDVLDISKLDENMLKFEFEAVDMAKILRETAKSLMPSIKRKKLRFNIDIPPKLPFAKADRKRIIQAVSNLINNAVKFTEKGYIGIQARKKVGNILISITDTGIGISKENQRKLFKKFFQVETSARREPGSTGLGLAISKGIIESHKGRIWAASKLGKGSTFFFTIPYIKPKIEKIKKRQI